MRDFWFPRSAPNRAPASERIAVVVVAYGAKYFSDYLRYFFNSHFRYCLRHGYHLIVLTEESLAGNFLPLQLSWLKVLSAGSADFRDFDRVILVDADMGISRSAPAVHKEARDPQVIYAVDELSQASEHNVEYFSEKPGLTAREYYWLANIELDTDLILNTGFLVFTPTEHQHIFSESYVLGVEQTVASERGFHYEQSVLGARIQTTAAFKTLPSKWNRIYSMAASNPDYAKIPRLSRFFSAIRSAHFVHFSGATWNTFSNRKLVRIAYGDFLGLTARAARIRAKKIVEQSKRFIDSKRLP